MNSLEKAIKKVAGPCVIFAGAGTGKTHTIVEKVKYMIENKIYSPQRIACLTFSNKAAQSLSFRIKKELKEDFNETIVKTFHGFSSMLLKKYGEKIGLEKNFSVLDTEEVKVILHGKLKIPAGKCDKYASSIGVAKDIGIKVAELKEHLKEKNILPVEELKSQIEKLKIESHTLKKEQFASREKTGEKIKKLLNELELQTFVNYWESYEKLKKKEHYQDYADLNSNALELLQEFPEIKKEFDYVVVDEFQDTNKVQLDIIFSIAEKKNITIVGDFNQSIYRFRGAYKDNYSIFKKHFNVLENDLFTLNKSYRSPDKILRVAHQLISKNYESPEECLFVTNFQKKEGEQIEVYELLDNYEEARKVSEIIEKESKRHTPEEICVMYRTHQQGEIIKKILDMKRINYHSINKKSLLKEEKIKKIINFMKIIEDIKTKNKSTLYNWWEILHMQNLSAADMIEIGKIIKESKKTEDPSSYIMNSLENLNLTEEGKIKVMETISKIKMLVQESDKKIQEIIELSYKLVWCEEENREKEEVMNFARFSELAENFSKRESTSLSHFLHYLNILENLQIDVECAETEKKGVRLMSVHSTKGLEYEIVILTNMAEKRFPLEKSKNNHLIPLEIYPEIKDLEEKNKEKLIEDYEKKHQLLEERRLCYVAMTRAKEKLYITYAKKYNEKECGCSIFLKEMNFKNNQDITITEDFENKFQKIKEEAYKRTNNESKEVERTQKIFSPSALFTFVECQKKFEYKYVYNMPDKESENWENVKLGSFVHIILEKGVKNKFSCLTEFMNLAYEMHTEPEWESLDIVDITTLLTIFFERNKDKYTEKSLTEERLWLNIEDVQFMGVADRIDFNNEGITVVEYKTGSKVIGPKQRNLQLGYYALAAQQKGKVKRVILDMLRNEKPLEFEIDEKGNAVEQYSKRMSFNIFNIEKEMIETVKKIKEAYQKGFKECDIEKNCPFCKEFFALKTNK